jgi:hypothetical protein
MVQRRSKSAERSHVRRWTVVKADDARNLPTADNHRVALAGEPCDRVIEEGAAFEFGHRLVATESP